MYVGARSIQSHELVENFIFSQVARVVRIALNPHLHIVLYPSDSELLTLWNVLCVRAAGDGLFYMYSMAIREPS